MNINMVYQILSTSSGWEIHHRITDRCAIPLLRNHQFAHQGSSRTLPLPSSTKSWLLKKSALVDWTPWEALNEKFGRPGTVVCIREWFHFSESAALRNTSINGTVYRPNWSIVRPLTTRMRSIWFSPIYLPPDLNNCINQQQIAPVLSQLISKPAQNLFRLVRGSEPDEDLHEDLQVRAGVGGPEVLCPLPFGILTMDVLMAFPAWVRALASCLNVLESVSDYSTTY